MNENNQEEMRKIAARAIDEAASNGIGDARARVTLSRDVSVTYRKALPDKVEESSRRGLDLFLYADGRYNVCQTNDLREGALARFINSSSELCKSMSRDEFREMPDPSLYRNRKKVDLDLFDPDIANGSSKTRHDHAAALEAATLKNAEKVAISAEATYQESESEMLQLHSNGFEGYERETQFWTWAELSIRDEGNRRPSGSDAVGTRFLKHHESPEELGRRVAKRAMDKLGASKLETQKTTMVVENRAVPRLLGHVLQAASGRSLQQKTSFLDGCVGEKIGSPLLTMVDDPFVPGGFGSRLFDSEGISAKKLPIFEKGVFKNFYIDTYYGKKLKMAPTTGGSSNVVLAPGSGDLTRIVSDIDRGILVSGFIGGNANPTTGDFSHGIFGTLIENGSLTKPVAEMNISGNNKDLWSRLVAVGNDPYPYSRNLTPTMVFDGIQFSGS